MTNTKKDNGEFTKFLDTINSQFGNGSAMTEDYNVDIEKCSYGTIGLDIASGGGSGVGKWIEIFGKESTGKTTLLIYKMIEYQKKYPKLKVAIIDFEQSFDINYARGLGLDTSKDKFVISQPDYGEKGFDIAEKFIKSNFFSLIGVDSIAAAIPKSELESETENQSMGVHARLMSKVCRKLKGLSNKHSVSMFWINQIREKIGVMFGNPEVTTGGNAMKFYADQRIKLRKSEKNDLLKKGKTAVTARFIKNKIAPPFGETTYSLFFGKGINKSEVLLDIAEECGIIKKTGSWYNYEDVKIGQGKENAVKTIEDNLEMLQEIEKKVRVAYELDI